MTSNYYENPQKVKVTLTSIIRNYVYVPYANNTLTYQVTINNPNNRLERVQINLVINGTNVSQTFPVMRQNTQIVGITYKLTQSDLDAGQVNLDISQASYMVERRGLKETLDITSDINSSIITCRIVSIALDKESSLQVADVGDTITYTYTITNTGNVTLYNVVLHDDKLDWTTTLVPPYSQSLPITGLIPDASIVVTRDYIVTQEEVEHGYVENTATVSGWTNNCPPEKATDTDTVTVIACVVQGTNILMSDGSLKPVELIQRGDWVAPGHQVARICQDRVNPNVLTQLIVLPPHTLGEKPEKELKITPNHAIIYRNTRKPAKCLTALPEINVINCRDQYLYDLQFDHEGTYFANGVEVQSRSPYSILTPLPKELYFNSELYSDERVWDCYDHVIPLDETVIDNSMVEKNQLNDDVLVY